MSAGDEFVDIVNDAGNTIAVVTRREMRAKKLPHRAVYVLVFNRRGDLFIHLRTPTKDIWPGRWDICIGGVVAAGESFDGGVGREVREELGIDVPVEPLWPFRYGDEIHGMVYRGVSDGPFQLQVEEIVRGEFVPPGEVLARAKREAFCPDGMEVLVRYLFEQGPMKSRSRSSSPAEDEFRSLCKDHDEWLAAHVRQYVRVRDAADEPAIKMMRAYLDHALTLTLKSRMNYCDPDGLMVLARCLFEHGPMAGPSPFAAEVILLGKDHDEWLAAHIRQYIRAIDATDEAAIEMMELYLEDALCLTLKTHLSRCDSDWMNRGNHQTDRWFDGMNFEFEDRKSEGVRLRGEIYWLIGQGPGMYDPFEFELDLSGPGRTLSRYVMRFGDCRPLDEKRSIRGIKEDGVVMSFAEHRRIEESAGRSIPGPVGGWAYQFTCNCIYDPMES